MTSRRRKPVPDYAAMLMAALIALLASAPVLAASGLCSGACGGMTHPVTVVSAAESPMAGAPLRNTGMTPADAGCVLDCCALCAPVLVAAPGLLASGRIGLVFFVVPARSTDSIHSVPTLPPPRPRT